ncbi:MAG: ABC transporter permease [Tepidisphaeraceae bacterium]|jgi:ABC-type transport system involved in multi-copper enzyme maturation permease subunit
MRNLLWKEWHEQSWKLGFGCIVLGALALIGLHSRIVADQTLIIWVNFLGMTMLPVLSSTGLVPAERGEGSLESLLALPVKPWRILAAKTAMGIALCIGPMLVAAVVSLLVAGGREMPDSAVVAIYAKSTVATLSLFIWMLALTIQLPSEARAALVGVGLLVFWMLASAGLADPSVPRWALAISPFALFYGVADQIAEPLPAVIVLAVQAGIALGLWIWASKRLSNLEGQS